jgi:hypothetical protein
LIVACLILSPTATVSAADVAEPITVLLTFGVGADSEDVWDGSLSVTDGEIVSLEERDVLHKDLVAGPPRTDNLAGPSSWRRRPRTDGLTGPYSWRLRTRPDDLPGFSPINYMEMEPFRRPRVLFHPVGLYLTVLPRGPARVTVTTAQGDFSFALSEIGDEPTAFVDGRASAVTTPAVKRLTTEESEDDEPAIARLPGGSIAVAWVAYRNRGDRVLLRMVRDGEWTAPEEVTAEPGDIFRCSLAVDGEGHLWVFWSQREGDRWHIWGRQRRGDRWQEPVRISDEGSNTFHRAASSGDGEVFVVWQSFRGLPGAVQSDIFMRRYADGPWSEELRVSTSPANDWEPAIAVGRDGLAYIAWDGYDRGNYDVYFRTFADGRLGEVQAVTSSPRFEAHASIAVDPEGRPWLAWDSSGANWGKDQGFLINPPIAVPLHQERVIRLAVWDGERWLVPRETIEEFSVYRLFPNLERPQIAFDSGGVLTMVFRHWTRVVSRFIGSPIGWENYLTRFDGKRWTTPTPLAHSRGSIEKLPALVTDDAGDLWAAWMTDDREFTEMVPGNGEIYAANLGTSITPPSYGPDSFMPLSEPFVEEVPIHPDEARDVQTVRDYTVVAGDRSYKIYRGDLHRHSDVSQDFKYDGSLIEVYRYALDAAALDFIAPTDHQSGWDQEFTWWQDEKLVDLFHLPGSFTPLFGYERSLPFPNGHRNVFFAHRGVRTLPIPDQERRGEVGAGKLFEYLHDNDGISIPHSSGTAQGTDFRDNDPEIEPLLEIFQGYRASYEYRGAPKAASDRKLLAQRSGYNPSGYWWEALAKGLKLGVIASSDHWSTHISYACILSEEFTRQALFDAIKHRHAYGATDNIVLDFQAISGGDTYIMGDIIRADTAPMLTIRAIGTDTITQLVIVKNQRIIYSGRPNARTVDLEFSDHDFETGANYYYVRVLQHDGQLAWSSPIWVESPDHPPR